MSYDPNEYRRAADETIYVPPQEKEAVRREEYLRNAPPEKLQEEYRDILAAHAGKYPRRFYDSC